jgi:hypothetical protein
LSPASGLPSGGAGSCAGGRQVRGTGFAFVASVAKRSRKSAGGVRDVLITAAPASTSMMPFAAPPGAYTVFSSRSKSARVIVS